MQIFMEKKCQTMENCCPFIMNCVLEMVFEFKLSDRQVGESESEHKETTEVQMSLPPSAPARSACLLA